MPTSVVSTNRAGCAHILRRLVSAVNASDVAPILPLVPCWFVICLYSWHCIEVGRQKSKTSARGGSMVLRISFCKRRNINVRVMSSKIRD